MSGGPTECCNKAAWWRDRCAELEEALTLTRLEATANRNCADNAEARIDAAMAVCERDPAHHYLYAIRSALAPRPRLDSSHHGANPLKHTVWNEVEAERARAHTKHGATSMESMDPLALIRLSILMEEVGEVAREFNDARHHGVEPDASALRKELIQVAAMAGAWADVLGALPWTPRATP